MKRSGLGLAATALLLSAGCGARTSDEAPRHDLSVARSAVFTNGDFESDAIGVVPTGWTVSTFLNPGITDTRPSPQTLASLNLATGGYAATHVVGGALESQSDPDLGTGASLRFRSTGCGRRS